jgi:hypothetical protein
MAWRAFLVGLGLSVATIASAQTNTSCTVLGNQIDCRSSSGGIVIPPNWAQTPQQAQPFNPGQALEEAERIKLLEAQRKEADAEAQAQQAQSTAASAAASGDCSTVLAITSRQSGANAGEDAYNRCVAARRPAAAQERRPAENPFAAAMAYCSRTYLDNAQFKACLDGAFGSIIAR